MKRNIEPTPETWTDREGHCWPVFIKPEDYQPKLVKFGRGRTVIDYGSCDGGRSRCECYDDPETFFEPSRWWTHDHAERRSVEQFEGVPFVDMREAVRSKAGYKMAVSGPMVDVDLPVGGIDKLCDPDPIFTTAMQGTEYGVLLGLQKVQRAAGTVGALDSVDLATWLDMWRDAGAVVGVIRNGEFVTQ